MRIIAGKYKGKNFFMPAGIRPTQDIVRGAIFDILGQDMEGVTFLDLFAGSGAVGLEAVSRGAWKVTFVEKDPKCAEVITENIGLLPIEPDESGGLPYEIVQTDAFAAVKLFARQGKKFDIIFIDPPYGRGPARRPRESTGGLAHQLGKSTGGLAKKTLKTLGAYDILQPNCVVVLQHEHKEILPEHEGRILLFRRKKYGHSILSIYKSEARSSKLETNTKF